jgi:hypothetical protein
VEEMEDMIYGQTLNVFKIVVNCKVEAYGARTLRRNTLGDMPSLYANGVNYLSADM